MITIKSLNVSELQNRGGVKLECLYSVNQEEKRVWLEVNEPYGQYLVTDRCDGFLIAVLQWAMRHGHDITCNVPVSDDLLFNLDNTLIDALSRNSKNLYRSKIFAEPLCEKIVSEGAVGTGVSGGIDSFSTIIKYSETKYKNHNLTHLMFNNVGSHFTPYEKQSDREMAHRLKMRSFCQSNGYLLVETNSNISLEFPEDYELTNTYMNVFVVLCLQKLYSRYYYSSAGWGFDGLTLINNDLRDSARYDMFLLPLVSTRTTQIMTSLVNETRLEKTKLVADWKPAFDYLDVCDFHSVSCMHCSKCLRTLFALEIYGKEDNFKNVFDIEDFHKHHDQYLTEFYAYYRAGKDFFGELYPPMKHKIRLKHKLGALVFYAKKIKQKFIK